MKFMADARQISSDTALARVFTKHDDKAQSGFITRLDRTPVARKRLFFLRNLIYNLIILSGSTTLVIIVILHSSVPNVSESLRLTFSFTQGAVLLWAAFVLVCSTSIPFFLGECRLRWKYGFKPNEIVIRRSPPESFTTQDCQEKCWRASLRAIDPSSLYSNPSSILAAEFWVMEHTIAGDLYTCMEAGELVEEDLEFTFWKRVDGVWKGLELWPLQSTFLEPQEIALFKAFLTSKGKYELLSAWERLFDSGKPSIVQTSEKYKSMVKRFSQEGIDYEAIWNQIERPCAA